MLDKIGITSFINPQAPVAQKSADEVVFRRFQFSVGFYITIMFWVRWFYSLFERISDESALIRNFLRNGRVRG